MLFLLNEAVIDLGDPCETLRACGAGMVGRIPSLARLTRHGQEAAFAARDIAGAHENVQRALAALLVLTGEVNCALFLCPPKARSARDVAVRFALAPITTLAFLYSAQESGRLTPALINQNVWRLASAEPAA
jgi:hypothetical protein